MLKFEERWDGEYRQLIVKNITEKDLKEGFSCEAKGDKSTAKLEKQKPFVTNLANTQGFMQGIAVFECQVESGMQVTWYYGSKKINRQNFR